MRRQNRPKLSENVTRVTPTGNTPTCGQENSFSLSVVPIIFAGSRNSLRLPLGRVISSERGAIGRGVIIRTRSAYRHAPPRTA